MGLRPNRCLFGAPPPYPGIGRLAKHGLKMKLSDSTTWLIPVDRCLYLALQVRLHLVK